MVTGASGFVGRVLCDVLAAPGCTVRKAMRSAASDSDAVAVGEIGPATNWEAALDGVSTVVHLAARTHILRETAADPLAEYRRINVAGTERLARSAAASGVRRLVFLSSVKVNGESTGERPFSEDDPPRPEDAYGVSKRGAEEALARVAAETGLETVVLRPPLVYGPGVKANFLRLMDYVARGMPLPLGTVVNRRSMIYAGNLAHAIVTALDAPQAAGRTYLVSDGEDVSTPELVHMLAHALGVKPRLLPVPLAALGIAATLAGKRTELARLTGSLQVNSSRLRSELSWRPPFTLQQGLARTARWYHSRSA